MKGIKRFSFFMFITSFMPHANASTEKTSKVVIETIIYESAGENLMGQMAVASVIRNRSDERDLTFKEVVLQPKQFSCNNKGVKRHRYTQEEWNKAKKAWELSKDFRLDSNLYHAVYCKPYWASKVDFKARIGNHLFYKEEV